MSDELIPESIARKEWVEEQLKESGSMPVAEGKAKRVDDRRPKDF